VLELIDNQQTNTLVTFQFKTSRSTLDQSHGKLSSANIVRDSWSSINYNGWSICVDSRARNHHRRLGIYLYWWSNFNEEEAPTCYCQWFR
jgi:hypothetical protein